MQGLRPPIHILAGENVCIQATRPMHFGAALASRINWRISSGVRQHRLEDYADGDVAVGVERGGDLLGVLGHLAERLFTVKMLAAGDEPDFELGKLG